MTLQPREKRLLMLWILVVVPGLIYYFYPTDDGAPAVVGASVDTIPAAEKQLARMRQLAASVPGKEHVLATVTRELEAREKGLIQAETAAQAQAKLLQIVRGVAKSQSNPIEFRNYELGRVKPFGDSYGEVELSLNFEAGIEQIINFMSEITAQKEIIGTTDLRVGTANPKMKTMPVRLTVSAPVRKELVPDQKGSGF